MQNLPCNDGHASFYGKATTRIEGERIILRSYDTDVAYIYNGYIDRHAHVIEMRSATTLRHIKAFLQLYNFKAENKKQIIKDYGGGL